MRTVYLQKFIGQRKVSLAAAAAMIVSGDGLSEAGRLGQAHRAGNHRGVHLAGKIALDLFRHLVGQIGASVEHGQQHALQLA